MPRARKRCPIPGCDLPTPCPTHTPEPWSGSTRRATLPADWDTRRAFVLDRDAHRCQLAYPGSWPTSRGRASCAGIAAEVDHIGDPNDHRPEMLRAVCAACHRRRTQAQSAATRRRE